MKKSIRIGDGVAEFFGTHDGNIKYLESLLKVQVHIDGENNLTIDGEDDHVQLVERLVEDYAQLRAEIEKRLGIAEEQAQTEQMAEQDAKIAEVMDDLRPSWQKDPGREMEDWTNFLKKEDV